jgi:hypothetical protein
VMLKIRGMSISGNLLMGVNRFGHDLTEETPGSDLNYTLTSPPLSPLRIKTHQPIAGE